MGRMIVALSTSSSYTSYMIKNDPKQVNAQDETIHDLAKVTVEELPYDGGGWPGDGSGMDDFEDYNQNEGYDF